MRPQDLMIGDFVKFTDKYGDDCICKVIGITEDNEFFLRDMKNGEDIEALSKNEEKFIQPLEITEEFLEKNGFVKDKEIAGRDVYVNKTHPDVIKVFFFTIGTLIKVERMFRTHSKTVHSPDSPYIHQLQQACRLCGIKIYWKI